VIISVRNCHAFYALCCLAVCLTCVVIGDTGVGKSEFVNRYLGAQLFKASDSPFPVTLEPQVRSSVVDRVTRQAIDTEGPSDIDANPTSRNLTSSMDPWGAEISRR
jgi:GTPase SAR1 family protein